MEENLPLEMDFRHEAANAMRAKSNFSKLKRTSVVIPDVLWAKERVMVMDCPLPLSLLPISQLM